MARVTLKQIKKEFPNPTTSQRAKDNWNIPAYCVGGAVCYFADILACFPFPPRREF